MTLITYVQREPRFDLNYRNKFNETQPKTVKCSNILIYDQINTNKNQSLKTFELLSHTIAALYSHLSHITDRWQSSPKSWIILIYLCIGIKMKWPEIYVRSHTQCTTYGWNENQWKRHTEKKEMKWNIQHLLSSHKIDNFNCTRLVDNTDTDVAHIPNGLWPDLKWPATEQHRNVAESILIIIHIGNLQYCRFMNYYNTKTIWIMNAFIADIFLVYNTYYIYLFIICIYVYLFLLANDIFSRASPIDICGMDAVCIGFLGF